MNGQGFRLALYILALTFGAVGHASETPPGDPPPSEATEQKAKLELYAGPQVVELAHPHYPDHVRREGGEGWVNLQFMVDAEGKPYEIVVVDAIGHESLRTAAMRAIESSTFQPAHLNGAPVDAGLRRKTIFALTDDGAASSGARSAYRRLQRAVREDDKAGAERMMTRIVGRAARRNLREDAWLHVAKYAYYEKWGSRAEQLQALDRAVAHELDGTYLPDEIFRYAQLNRFRLLVLMNHFADAVDAFESLEQLDAQDPRLEGLRPMLDEVMKVQQDDRAFPVAGEVDDHGYWSHRLFKDRFALRDIDGSVVELKLYCDTGFVFFSFDAKLTYRLGEDHGDCTLTVVGNAGSTFTLVQG